MSGLSEDEMNAENLLESIGITFRTLVNVRLSNGYPVYSGNCFSVSCKDRDYRIVNFKAENLDELVKRGLTWPVKILPIGESVAVICDDRISDKWYDDQYCEVCCPNSLLPHPQKMRQFREILRGDRVETEGNIDGKEVTFVKVKIGNNKKQGLL